MFVTGNYFYHTQAYISTFLRWVETVRIKHLPFAGCTAETEYNFFFWLSSWILSIISVPMYGFRKISDGLNGSEDISTSCLGETKVLTSAFPFIPQNRDNQNIMQIISDTVCCGLLCTRGKWKPSDTSIPPSKDVDLFLVLEFFFIAWQNVSIFFRVSDYASFLFVLFKGV